MTNIWLRSKFRSRMSRNAPMRAAEFYSRRKKQREQHTQDEKQKLEARIQRLEDELKKQNDT